MNTMRKLFIATTVLSIVFAGCEKGTGYVDTSLPAAGAKVKFINASYNAPSVIFYGRDTTFKFSAALAGTGGVIQGTGVGATYPSNDYAVFAPYNDALKVKIPTNSTVSPGSVFDLGNLKIDDGRNYSVFLADSFPAISTVVVPDELKNFNSIGDSSYSARFVNLIYGVPSGPAVDIFSKNENAVILSNIPYKGATSFKDLKVFSTADEIQVRAAGTTTIIAKLAFTPTGKKTYTWFARGRAGATASPGLPVVSFYTNQ
jgi:hypothetical protein